MIFNSPTTLKQFAKIFNQYLDETGCMENDHGHMGSHNIVSDIIIKSANDNAEEDDYYVINEVDISYLVDVDASSPMWV